MLHIADWEQETSLDENLSIIKDLALSHAREGGTQGEHIANCIIGGDLLSLCNLGISYENVSVHEAANCRQALAYFSKNSSLTIPGVDPESEAIRKFKEAEAACKQTNDIFKMRAQGSFYFEPWVEAVLLRAQQKIARVMGDVPSLSKLKFRFGPGATTLTKKKKASIPEKLGTGLACSEALVPILSQVLEQMPHIVDLYGGPEYSLLYPKRFQYEEVCTRVPVLIQDGKVGFVPKKATTHRATETQPPLDSMVQLAYGDWLTQRLRAFGIDLKDQSQNQRLALEGSLCGTKATLDLSSASDTIAIELVFSLLPIDWALALSYCRVPFVQMNGERIQLEKFSGMGNGFTFPLESLIFWAISSSASLDDYCSIYGDDIVVNTESVHRVMRVLDICGFTLNKAKSYWTGPFRESCGVDYLRGMDIRPRYQETILTPAELFRLHNFYVRRGWLDYAKRVEALINPSLRIYGPDGFGDGHLLGDWVPKRHKKSTSHGYGGVIFDTFAPIAERDRRALRPGDRVLPVYSIYRRETGDPVLPPECDFATARLAGLYGRDLHKWSYASEPMPERTSPVDDVVYKTPSLPGTCGYKKISIYTFGTGR